MTQSEWFHFGSPPLFDDIREYEVWLGHGAPRRVKRVGHHSLSITPGTLCFTDCFHPLQNAICAESAIQAWRPCEVNS